MFTIRGSRETSSKNVAMSWYWPVNSMLDRHLGVERAVALPA